MYTKENVIFFNDDERVSGLIGKEVYYSTNPYSVLAYANEDTMHGKLLSATDYGFLIEGSEVTWEFIIGREESYIPYKSMSEFALHYDSAFDNLDYQSQLMFRGGFWLIDKHSKHRFLVKEFTDKGIVLDYEVLDWEYVLENLLMPDKTPCGVKEE